MNYCTQDDLTDRYGERELVQLTDDTGRGVIDSVKLDRAIADAGAEIDGYLSARYRLPLASVPQAVTRLACDIARHQLYDDAVPEHVRQRYEDAVRTLRAISRGEVSLGLDQSSQAATGAGTVEFDAPDRVFDDDGLDGF